MPENENNQSPKKKRGFLWVIIIILMVVLAAVIGGYALSQCYGTPAWLSGILPGNEVSAPAPVEETVEPLTVAPPAPVKTSPVPTQTPQASDVEEPKESTQPESPVATAVPTPAVTATPTIGADAAAEAALKHSKVNEKDADVSSVLLVEQNGMMLYEVCFSTKDNQYEYLLDASTGRVESRQQEVSEISRMLKELARNLNVPVLALSQLSRKNEDKTRVDNKPQLSDLRESGSIEQDADVVALIHRDWYYKRDDESLKNKATLIIAKQRNGPVGDIDLAFFGEYALFTNPAPEHMEVAQDMGGDTVMIPE